MAEVERNMKKEMYKGTCTECKKESEFPFNPAGDYDRPLYCKDCFAKKSLTITTTTSKKDEVLLIETSECRGRDKFGRYNKGTLSIIGNAGDEAGSGNKGTILVRGGAGHKLGVVNKGTIIVNKNAGDIVGSQNKGTIIIKGNAGDYVGKQNKGIITVNGNAGNAVGWENKGTIIVFGTIKSLHKKASGTIIANRVKEDNGIPWLII